MQRSRKLTACVTKPRSFSFSSDTVQSQPRREDSAVRSVNILVTWPHAPPPGVRASYLNQTDNDFDARPSREPMEGEQRAARISKGYRLCCDQVFRPDGYPCVLLSAALGR